MTQRLTWQRVGKELKLTNPTPYYMNFHYVRIGGREMKEVTYIAPMSSEFFIAGFWRVVGQLEIN